MSHKSDNAETGSALQGSPFSDEEKNIIRSIARELLQATEAKRIISSELWLGAIQDAARTISQIPEKPILIEAIFDLELLGTPGLNYSDTRKHLGEAILYRLSPGRDDALTTKIKAFLDKYEQDHLPGLKRWVESLKSNPMGWPVAELLQQPIEPKQELQLGGFSTKALMQELAGRPDAPEETRQRLLWDIADFDRPKWKDKDENPEKLPPELRYAPAPVFLKIAWADEIDSKGRIYTQRVRHSDRKLVIAVEHYLDNRKGKEPLHAKGLTLVTGPVPTRPKEKAKRASRRIPAPR
jgi:hypothetical protein